MTHVTVGELAEICGVTVRTLHHYDEIGLLVPSARTAAGYRQYDDADIDRLQAILTYRELGLGLDEISAAVDSPEDSIGVLRLARRRLSHRMAKLQAIARSLDDVIAGGGRTTPMTPEEKLSVFGDFDAEAHEEEARERWGGTEAFAQSARRTSNYTKADWAAIDAEISAIYEEFMSLKRQGIETAAPEASEVVAKHRGHISRWFYDCSPEIHAGLGQMYVADERFAENIDKAGEGLARYMADAIEAAYSQ